jgi:adenylylsulfate kinase-like enzyme
MAKRILIMGLPGSGKTTLAEALRLYLWEAGRTVTWLNADEVRTIYND